MIHINRVTQHGPRVTATLLALYAKTQQLKREIAIDREPDKRARRAGKWWMA